MAWSVVQSAGYAVRESGLVSLYASGKDAWIIIAARSCRMFAYGASALVLALFFAELEVSDERIGLFMTLTLVGDVGLSLVLTLVADHVGRRRTLLFGSVLMVLSGATFALSENYWLLLVAAVAGVISATGGDFGPFRAVEESMLSELTDRATRADVLAWYVTTSALGSSMGSAMSGHAIQYLHGADGPSSGGSSGSDGSDGNSWPLLRAYHACYWAYAGMGVLNLVLSLLLSPACELHHGVAVGAGAGSDDGDSDDIAMTPQQGLFPSSSHDGPSRSSGRNNNNNDDDDDVLSTASSSSSSSSTVHGEPQQKESQSLTDASHLSRPSSSTAPSNKAPGRFSRFSQISAQTRRTMYGLWFLLMVDSVADGMANMALTSYYMDGKFHLGKDSLGSVLSASYFLSACSTVFAGPLSRHLGLVNTMVFTHVPSSAAVLLFPLPHSIALTYVLLLVRVGLNSLDQAPRSALIAAVVRPHERTAVMGITSMLRTLASTVGPSLTGVLAGSDRFWIAFVVAGALRLAYDLGLFVMFVNIRLYQYEAVPTSDPPATADAADADRERGATSPGESLVPPGNFVLDDEESVHGR